LSEELDDIEIIDDDLTEEEGVALEEPAKKASEKDPLISDEALEGADSLKKQIEELRKQKAAEESARKAAEARAIEREREANTYKNQVSSTQDSMLEQAITGAKAEIARLKDQARIAFEEGDYKKGMDLQEKMSEGVAFLSQLNVHKAQAKQQSRQEVTDPFERAINNYSDRTKTWLREHPECVQDPNTAHKAAAAHHNAILNGLRPDTDAYFNYVEEQLGYSEPEETVGQKPAQRKAVPTAPAGRSTSSPTKPGNIKRNVPARFVRAAQDMGISLKDYIKSHDEAVKAGAMEAQF
jgi:hypothetical protein